MNVKELRQRLEGLPDEAEVILLQSAWKPKMYQLRGTITDEQINPLHLWTHEPEGKRQFVFLVPGEFPPMIIHERDLKRAFRTAK